MIDWLMIVSPLLPLLLYLFLSRDKSAFSPPGILLGVLATGSLLKAFYLFSLAETGHWDEFTTWLPWGSFYMSLGTLSFMIGYCAIKSGLTAKISIDPTPFYLAYFVFVALSCLLMLVYLYNTNIWQELISGRIVGKKFFESEDGIKSSFGFLSLGAECGVVIASLAIPRPSLRFGWKLFYASIFALSIFVFLVSTQRTAIVFSSLLLLLCLWNRESPFLSGKSLGIIAIVGMTILLATSIRSAGRDGVSISNSTSPFTDVSSGLLHQMYTKPYFLTPDKTGRVVINTREQSSFLYGKSFVALFATPVPRVLWKEKPNIRIGPYVAQTVYGRFESGVPPGLIAELYMNFGFVGVVAGMTLLGMLGRVMYMRYIKFGANSISERCLYGIFVVGFLIVAVIADFNGGILRFTKLALSWTICVGYWQVFEGFAEMNEEPDCLPNSNRKAAVDLENVKFIEN